MARPITDTLRAIQQGALVDDATDKLRELLLAVEDTGRPGKLVIELAVSRATRGGAVNIKGRVLAKPPTDDAIEAIFWVGPEGDPLAGDPRQESLDLKVVEPPSSSRLLTAGE
jgi:hypothetical protein